MFVVGFFFLRVGVFRLLRLIRGKKTFKLDLSPDFVQYAPLKTGRALGGTEPMRMTCCLALSAVLGLGLAGSHFAQTKTPPKGSVERIKVHGKSLEGNLEGDSPDRDVFVYLPPSYDTNRNQRYPVVYLLHGYGLTGERWMTFTNLAENADKDIAAGAMKELILVNPDAFT